MKDIPSVEDDLPLVLAKNLITSMESEHLFDEAQDSSKALSVGEADQPCSSLGMSV